MPQYHVVVVSDDYTENFTAANHDAALMVAQAKAIEHGGPVLLSPGDGNVSGKRRWTWHISAGGRFVGVS